MGGENIAAFCFFDCFFERHTIGNQLTGSFQGEKGGMTFVHVPDGRLVSHGPQGADTTHAQQDLLGDTQVNIELQ